MDNNTYSGKKPDLTGQTFGHLTVTGPGKGPWGRAAWRCRCGCGNETVVRASALRAGSVGSCGCLGKAQVGGAGNGDD